MEYAVVRQKLLSLFDAAKLQASSGEWGFYNEIEREIACIGYATNLTPETIVEAGALGVQLLLTHHDSWPFVYGLKEQCNKLLEQMEISHAFFHAPLDDADFGTSASLARALGMHQPEKAIPYAGVFFGGVVGEVQPTPFDAFQTRLSTVLEEAVRSFQNNSRGTVQKVCVAAGGGNMTEHMQCAVEAGCDTYVTGEYVLYSQQYARLTGMNLFVGSHTNTEILGVRSLAALLAAGMDMKIVRVQETND